MAKKITHCISKTKLLRRPIAKKPVVHQFIDLLRSAEGATWVTAVITSIGIVGSLYFNFAAIREATNQRRVTYQPNIIIQPLFVELNIPCAKNSAQTQVIWRTSSDNSNWSTNPITIRLLNVGKGAAIDVGYLWNLGTPSHVEKLKTLGITTAQNRPGIEHEGRYYASLPSDEASNDNFIIPSEQGKPSASEVRPSSYMITELILQSVLNINKFGCDRFAVPLIFTGPKFDIQYFDIERNRFNEGFEVRYFTYSRFGKEDKELNKQGTGFLKIRYKVAFASTKNLEN